MTSQLDGYSAFYPPIEGKQFSEDTHREYFGVGFAVRRNAEPLTIDYLFADSPAERAGLKPGDRIVAVDGRPIDPKDIEKATAAIKGPIGTRVVLSVIVKKTGEEQKFPLNRNKITQPTVFAEHFQDSAGEIGYLRVSAFGENTAAEFDRKVKALIEQQVQGLILDLRFNQGGLVPSCQSIANRLLKGGAIVGIRTRDPEGNRTLNADPEECWLPDLPAVVLTNGMTASAAEIVAGALQDHQRALLVGERTFGKGVVQSVFNLDLDDEEDRTAVLKFTTSVYMTPSGRIIEKTLQSQKGAGGLAPDVKITLSEDEQDALRQRFAMLEIPAAYRQDVLEAHDWELPEPEDRPLAAALQLLKGESVTQDL
jgi:carboxyl-terminal processing protease